ncbi:MAG: hypothetical protein ACRDSL_10795 [Pseudonocardiaceae bacterium]
MGIADVLTARPTAGPRPTATSPTSSVAASASAHRLHPSGPTRATEPRGRRIDSPARPDEDAPRSGWRRQLRADAVLLTPAPIVGLLWAFLDGGGVLTWVCATTLAAALGLGWAALRGSDPT